MPTLDDLRRSPNALAVHYSRFGVTERVLLTGHSHQAWPDIGFLGQIEAWNDAAELVDEKWERAEAKAERVRRGFARLLGDEPDAIALGQNTHEMVTRFLSALPVRERPKLLTTDGEFHSLRRQMDRLAEERALEIVKVSATPSQSIAERLIAAIDSRTAAVLTSSVLFGNAHIVPDLGAVYARCRELGAEMLVDAYHHLNVLPFSIQADGLEEAFVVGGGYKYCQLGEGNCFLRVPPGRDDLRPVLTGWFSEFAHLTDRANGVPYGDGAARWAGATYDPTSHYRAARVFDFFEGQELAPELLRAVSRHQVGLLAQEFDALDLDASVIARDRSVPFERIAGFLALNAPRAGEIAERLRAAGVLVDHRGEILRFGPAPYLADRQVVDSMRVLGEVVGKK